MIKDKFYWSKLWLVVIVSLFYTSVFGQESLPKNFDEWVEASRQDWKIPGMAIGIVKDGEVVYAKGFGEKKLGSGEAVDANTIFSIASVSKNITAAALGILVDEGKINWDDKVTKHIPWFQLKDPWVTNELTIRDALVHRVGSGRVLGNRLQFMTDSPRDTILYQMRYMDLEKPFRSEYVYNNVMYSLVGQIIEHVEGVTWDEFLQTRLFEPLGMTSATTSITAIKKDDNQAYPHQEIEGKVVSIGCSLEQLLFICIFIVMNIEKLKDKILSLPKEDRERLLREVTDSENKFNLTSILSRRHEFDNKTGVCPHCSHPKYVRFGKDKGAQRYKCKSCERSFTEYTGTWMAGIHKKEKIVDYLKLMIQEKSLDKIVLELGINKKTAFDWRHKILASLSNKDEDFFSGITESDESFMLRSEKGMEVKGRKPRKRGGKSKKRGVSKDQVAIIATQDRNSLLDLSEATLGRITKEKIKNEIDKGIKKK